MALTQTAWAQASVNGKSVFSCRVSGTDDTDLPTLRTPKALDGSKPFAVIVKPNEDMTAAGASAVDIWGCLSDSASLAVSDAGTDCVLVHANSLDLDAGATTLVINVFPGIEGTVTQVTNATPGTALIAPFPYYIINVDMTAQLQDAAYVDFFVVQ